jgi:hypothetical protein
LKWTEFAEASPELAQLGQERFEKSDLLLIGTIRKGGTPRISPIEFQLLDGELLLGMMWQSKKALDLLRDPRCLLHNVVANKDGTDGEFKLRGRATDVTDPGFREKSAKTSFEKTGWRPSEPYHLFTIDIEKAAFVQFSSNGDQTVLAWRAGGPVRKRLRKWTGSAYES